MTKVTAEGHDFYVFFTGRICTHVMYTNGETMEEEELDFWKGYFSSHYKTLMVPM